MSLSERITDAVSVALGEYVKRVLASGKCTLSRDELMALWNGDVETTDKSVNDLNKAELVAMCKKKGLKCTGRKEELVSRIIAFDEGGQQDNSVVKNKTVSTSIPVSSLKSTKKDAANFLKQKLSTGQKEIRITTNEFGNDVHADTGLVFNRSSQAIGKQTVDGTVATLSIDDINICNKYGFEYIIPDNLNSTNTVSDTKDDSDLELYSQGDDDDEDDIEDYDEDEIIEEED